MKFAIFVCTHGRPREQLTLKALREAGYTGDIYLVVDDEDNTVCELYKYGCVVKKFCKQDYIDKMDIGVRRECAKRGVILYAKQACEDFAKALGLDAFGIADDDFTGFRFRYEEGTTLKSQIMHTTFDKMIEYYLDFLLGNNLCMTSIGTNQMFMGGQLTSEKISSFRVPYSFVFRNTSIEFDWVSELFEDVISETIKTQQGYFMMQMPFVQLNLKPLYAGAEGGMTKAYQSVSFVGKLFSVVQYLPSCAKITSGRNSAVYTLSKENAFPKLISSHYKK